MNLVDKAGLEAELLLQTEFLCSLILIISPFQQTNGFLGIVFFVLPALVLFSFISVAVIFRQCCLWLELPVIV